MMERENREAALEEQEDSYLKLLRTLSEATEHGADSIGVVRRIATWIESPRVLEIIGGQRAWVEDWGIKEALVQNPSTPRALRASPERQVAVIDLLRELDSGGFDSEERREILEDARSLISALPPADRRAVQRQAYELSRSRSDPGVGETGSLFLREAPTPEVSPQEQPPDASPLPCPEPVYEELTEGELEDLFPAPTAIEPAPPEGPETETEDEEQDGDGEAAELAEAPVVPEPTEPGVVIETTEPEPSQPRELSWRADAARAAQSKDSAELSRLAHSSNEEVQLALVANPLLPEPAAVQLARRAGFRVAEALFRNKALFNRPRVRNALLECPNAPAAAQIQAVNQLSDFTTLVRLLGSPRIRHLEVKAVGRSRLRSMFKALSQGEKMAAIRGSGRAILRHLWSDFFRDEPLVLRCLQEKQLDDGMVLEIARSRIAPRRALEVIGGTSSWTAQYPILLALVTNPKTPRQVALRLLPRLKPADRKALQKNPAVPGAVRHKA